MRLLRKSAEKLLETPPPQFAVVEIPDTELSPFGSSQVLAPVVSPHYDADYVARLSAFMELARQAGFENVLTRWSQKIERPLHGEIGPRVADNVRKLAEFELVFGRNPRRTSLRGIKDRHGRWVPLTIPTPTQGPWFFDVNEWEFEKWRHSLANPREIVEQNAWLLGFAQAAPDRIEGCPTGLRDAFESIASCLKDVEQLRRDEAAVGAYLLKSLSEETSNSLLASASVKPFISSAIRKLLRVAARRSDRWIGLSEASRLYGIDKSLLSRKKKAFKARTVGRKVYLSRRRLELYAESRKQAQTRDKVAKRINRRKALDQGNDPDHKCR